MGPPDWTSPATRPGPTPPSVTAGAPAVSPLPLDQMEPPMVVIELVDSSSLAPTDATCGRPPAALAPSSLVVRTPETSTELHEQVANLKGLARSPVNRLVPGSMAP